MNVKVLVFPGGTEIGIEIYRSLRYCKEVELCSASQPGSSHAPYVYRKHFEVPSVHNEGWLQALQELLRGERIDYIYPAHDEVLMALVRQREALSAKVVASPRRTCEILRSKKKTYESLRDCVAVPDVFTRERISADSFPVFVKPEKGQGSQRAHRISGFQELDHFTGKHDDLLITEYLPFEEYTIDCFSDREQGLKFCRGRRRRRTRDGISTNSYSVLERQDEFTEIAERINQRFSFHGAWFYQAKLDKTRSPKLLEVGPRIAGTMGTHRAAGVNFPLLSLYEHEREAVEVSQTIDDIELDRAFVNRYRHNISFSTVYVDYDDTLLYKGKINTSIVELIYQCLNENKKIILITKHEGNIKKSLKSRRLSGLFDEVIHIKEGQKKHEFMTEEDSIFIDDSFSERKGVEENTNIKALSPSMIEILIDHRS